MCKNCRATEKGIKDDFVCDGCLIEWEEKNMREKYD
tara:strand:- start:244 stop:351 length:108 start_codon:yes stop_codon:yes gene_type:complete